MSNEVNFQEVFANSDCLYTEAQVEAAMDKMGEDISRVLADKNPVVLCVMNGGMIPAVGLLKRMQFPLELDYLHATRYHGSTEGGDILWVKTPSANLEGRTVLILDDILDEGLTLQAIINGCQGQSPKDIYSAVLAEKDHTRKNGVLKADFTGLIVEDRYVFGYGMDYHNNLRNVNGIYAIKE